MIKSAETKFVKYKVKDISLAEWGRKEIALAGQKFILENYSYKKLMIEVDKVLKESYFKKFPNKK